MTDGMLRSSPTQSLPPPAANPAWTIMLLLAGGLIFFTLSRLWNTIVNYRESGRKGTIGVRNSTPGKHMQLQQSPPPPVSAVAKKSAQQFRDKGLDAVMEKCKKIKTKLRKVKDPEVARKAKIAELLLKQKPQGPLQITPDKLQIELQSLRAVELVKRREEPTTKSGASLGASSSFLQDVRRKLKPVASVQKEITCCGKGDTLSPCSSSTSDTVFSNDERV